MLTRSHRTTPAQDRTGHRLFDLVVLPLLALVTLFLIYKALGS